MIPVLFLVDFVLIKFPDSKTIYNTGNTKRVKNVAINKPPITTVAKGRCTSAPAPSLKAIGKNPKDATHAVINTGKEKRNHRKNGFKT